MHAHFDCVGLHNHESCIALQCPRARHLCPTTVGIKRLCMHCPSKCVPRRSSNRLQQLLGFLGLVCYQACCYEAYLASGMLSSVEICGISKDMAKKPLPP